MNHTDTNNRRRLFKRLEGELPPLSLTERDVGILQLVKEYRFMNSAQIQALVGGSAHNVGERLSRLFHHGYLDRPSQQRELRAEGYRLMVYALAPKGARVLAREEGELSRVPRHLAEDNRTAKRFYLAHTLMVSQFRTCLTLACKGRPDIRLTRWRVPDKPIAQAMVGRHRVAVIPDAHFVLEDSQGRLAHFFLEADRGTMTLQRFLSKLQAYWQMRTIDVGDALPRAFRVLTLAPSKRRMENLLRTATDADPRHSGSRMFCFTIERDYDLKNPDALFGPIWRTPADAWPRSILDETGGRRE
jgi:hypothetical protein